MGILYFNLNYTYFYEILNDYSLFPGVIFPISNLADKINKCNGFDELIPPLTTFLLSIILGAYMSRDLKI